MGNLNSPLADEVSRESFGWSRNNVDRLQRRGALPLQIAVPGATMDVREQTHDRALSL